MDQLLEHTLGVLDADLLGSTLGVLDGDHDLEPHLESLMESCLVITVGTF